MKKIVLILSMLFSFALVNAQSSVFDTESGVVNFMNSKVFYNTDNGLQIQYTYTSMYNTYAIKVTNKNGVNFFYVNCDITPYGDFADIFGMSPENGSNFGFRVYKNRLIVGRGKANESIYYLK